MTTTTRTIFATGRRRCVAGIQIDQTPHNIIATAEADKFTDRQMQDALAAEFPGRTFQLAKDDGYLYARSVPEVMSNGEFTDIS